MDNSTDYSLLAKKSWYEKKRRVILIIILIVFLIAGVIFVLQVFRYTKEISSGENFLRRTDEVAPAAVFNKDNLSLRPIIESKDDPILGPAEAAVTIVEFSDFQCPFCRQSFPIIRELEKYYQGKIKVIYRDFPISQIHPDAMLAHLAANCAYEQGKFWAMHDKIFQNQERIKENDLKNYAAQIGLDRMAFNSCLSSNKYTQEINEDLQNGLTLGVSGTPTWFINGYKLEGVISLDTWKDLIEGVLGNKR